MAAFGALQAVLAGITAFSTGSAGRARQALGTQLSGGVVSPGTTTEAWAVPAVVGVPTAARMWRLGLRATATGAVGRASWPAASQDLWRVLAVLAAGCLVGVGLLLAIDATVHAQVTQAVRLSTDFRPGWRARSWIPASRRGHGPRSPLRGLST